MSTSHRIGQQGATIVNVTQEELDQLRRDQERFHWLLRMFAQVTRQRPAEVLQDMDEMRGSNIDLADWDRRVRAGMKAKRTPRGAYGMRRFD